MKKFNIKNRINKARAKKKHKIEVPSTLFTKCIKRTNKPKKELKLIKNKFTQKRV